MPKRALIIAAPYAAEAERCLAEAIAAGTHQPDWPAIIVTGLPAAIITGTPAAGAFHP